MMLDTGNYRNGVTKLARDLGLPKLTKTHDCHAGAKEGHGQGRSGTASAFACRNDHGRVQEIPESVQATINAIHAELKKKPESMQAG